MERIEALLLGSGAVYLPATERILVRLAPRFARAKEGEVSDPVMLAALAQTGALAGLPAGEIAALARRALRDERLLAGHPPAHHAACGALSWADALEEAGRAADAGIAEAQRRGSAPFFALASTWRAGIALRAGELELAEAISERGHELAQERVLRISRRCPMSLSCSNEAAWSAHSRWSTRSSYPGQCLTCGKG